MNLLSIASAFLYEVHPCFSTVVSYFYVCVILPLFHGLAALET